MHAGQCSGQKWCSFFTVHAFIGRERYSAYREYPLITLIAWSVIGTSHMPISDVRNRLQYGTLLIAVWSQHQTHVDTICAFVRQAACCGICTNSSRTEDETCITHEATSPCHVMTARETALWSEAGFHLLCGCHLYICTSDRQW